MPSVVLTATREQIAAALRAAAALGEVTAEPAPTRGPGTSVASDADDVHSRTPAASATTRAANARKPSTHR